MHSWGVESTARVLEDCCGDPPAQGHASPTLAPHRLSVLQAAHWSSCRPRNFLWARKKPLVLAQKGQKYQGTEGSLEITRIARVIHTRGWICLGREEVKRTLGTECGLESQQVPQVALETQYVVVCAHLMPTLEMADGCPFWVRPLHPSTGSGGNLTRVRGSSLRPQAHRVQQPPRAA